MIKFQHADIQFHPTLGGEAARGFGRDRSMRPVREPIRGGRFVTQSHVLSAPMARPSSLAIAAAVAVALVLVTRRLTH